MPATVAPCDVAATAAAAAARAASPRRRALPAAALVALAALGICAPASQAAWRGSSGKVAWVHDGSLYVDDPADDEPPAFVTTVAKETDPVNPFAPVSAASWSPDGTKLAFTKALDDGGFPKHTAVFIADISEGLSSGGAGVLTTQLSHPYPGRVPSCDSCDDGENTYDSAPVWTPDGDVAYVRFVSAGTTAPHVGEVGSSVRVEPVAGQQSGLVAHWNPHTDGVMRSIVWPQDSSQPIAIAVTPQGFKLKKVVSKQSIADELGFDDVDASPDGSRIAYRALTLAGPRVKVVRTSTGELLFSFTPSIADHGVRFSPDGTRLLLAGCASNALGQLHCGIKTHTIPDPDGDIRPDDAVEAPYLDANPADMVSGSTAAGGRTTFDVQPQDTPVIFIPGFLGSEITCGGDHVWMPSAPPIHLERLALAADGTSEAGCQGIAAPTGKEVDSFLGADVYGHASDWLRALKSTRKGAEHDWYVLGWDWRKRPQESLQRLDEQIERLLHDPLPAAQGVRRVAIVTHSYGSLLLRRYLADGDHAQKVARAVTIGAPWWGAPKPMFPIAFGIESPDFSALDLFIKNANLRTFMTNSSGAYSLLPSDNYGQWLTYDGQPQDQSGVSRFLGSVGGNEALVAQGRALHQQIDGFTTAGGTIDLRNVTGLGLPTVTKVNVAPSFEHEASVGLVFGQGDGTVPVRSSAQGEEGTVNGLGDRVHQQYRCGIPHMRQTADEITQRAYADFLLDGAVPRKLPAPHCAISGLVVKVFRNVDLGQPAARAGRAATGPRSLADAELDGDVDVLQLPGGSVIVTAGDQGGSPVTFAGQGDLIEVSAADGSGEARRYGPLTGTVELGGTAADPQISVDGQRVAPQASGDGPAPAGSGTGGGNASGGASGGAGGAGAGAGQSQGALALTISAGKTLRPDARGRVRIVLTANAAASGTVALTDARRRALAPVARVRLRRAGKVTTTLTLSRAARAALRRGRIKATVTATLQPVSGPASLRTAAVILRAR